MSTDTDSKVLSILEGIKKNGSSEDKVSIVNSSTDVSNENQSKINKNDEIRGKPKSGRFWKTKKEK